MAEAQGDMNFESRMDSPSRNTKQSKQSTTDTPNAKDSSEDSANTAMHPPSTSSYPTPVMSPHSYMHHYMMSQYDSRSASSSQGTSNSPYDAPPRKRPHRSPSDPRDPSLTRVSVLRDGSKPERASPLSLAYSRSSTPPHSDYHPRHPTSPSTNLRYEVSGDNPTNVTPSSGTVLTTVPFDRSAAVESDAPADVWNSSSSCPEGKSFENHCILLAYYTVDWTYANY